MITDEQFMRLALQEARKGTGRTSPNPCVGAVIVKDGKVVSKGYHRKAGTPHAEINALQSADVSIDGATIYVTLEPCNHTGRTPPCSHAIVNSNIKRVVIGMEDPNPLVDGSGITYLQDNGVEVTTGVLRPECRAINRPFIKFITSGRPLVVMKAGVSLDGRINYQVGKSGWITGEQSSIYTHQLRDTYDAIMVGVGTILVDDPSLTTRRRDDKEGRDPVRIILDTQLRTPLSAKILSMHSKAPTWIFCDTKVSPEKVLSYSSCNVKVFPVGVDHDGSVNLEEVISVLGQEMITSILVEGGGIVHGSLLKKQLYDYAHLFYAPLFAGDQGVSVLCGPSIHSRKEAIHLERVRYSRLGDDLLVEGSFHYPGVASK